MNSERNANRPVNYYYNLTSTLIRKSNISSAVQTLTYTELLAGPLAGST